MIKGNISPNDVLEIINFIHASGACLPAGDGEGCAAQFFVEPIALLIADTAEYLARRRRF